MKLMTKPLVEIMSIAQQVRSVFVNGPLADQVCLEASAAVTAALVKAGYEEAVQVHGHVVGEPVGLLLDYELAHCWTEVDGHIVDVTVDQLNRDGASYPPVMIRSRADCPEFLSDEDWHEHRRAREWWGNHFSVGRVPGEPLPVPPPEFSRWSKFHELIAWLPMTQRQVVNQVFYREMDFEEAASHLRMTEDTVIRRWRAAQRHVHKKLWVDRSASDWNTVPTLNAV